MTTITGLTITGDSITIDYTPPPNDFGEYDSCSIISSNVDNSNNFSLSAYNLESGDTLDTSHELLGHYEDHHKIKLSDVHKENIVSYIKHHIASFASLTHIPYYGVVNISAHAIKNGNNYGLLLDNSSTQNNQLSLDNQLTPPTILFKNLWLDNNKNTIDWTDPMNNPKNAAFTCVNDQGQCGSCWGNNTTACITIRLAIITGLYCPIDLNQLISCDIGYGDNGCGGGLMSNAMTYIKKHPISGPKCSSTTYTEFIKGCGLTRCHQCITCENDNSDYTITISDGPRGLYNPTDSYDNRNANNIQSIINELMNGPICIAIGAGGSSFQHLNSSSNRYDWANDKTNAKKLNHAVLLVGHVICNNTEYWKIQNSWGTSWGDNGYYYVTTDYYMRNLTYCTPEFKNRPPNEQKYKTQQCCAIGQNLGGCTASPSYASPSYASPSYVKPLILPND